MKEIKEYRMEPLLLQNLMDCAELIQAQHPVIIWVDGILGEGKTTLTGQICDVLNNKPVEFSKFLGMGGPNFLKIYNESMAKLNACAYDEAGDFNKRGALSRLNTEVNKILQTFRQFKICIIMSLPRFYWSDTTLFELGVVRMLLHCHGRGRSFGRFNAYLPDSLGWLVHYAQTLKTSKKRVDLCYGMVKPNFRGLFYDYPKKRRDELSRYSLAGKKEITRRAAVSQQNLISLRDIAAKLGMKDYTVRRNISLTGLKPSQTICQTHYFDKRTVNKLLDKIKGEK